MATSLDLPARLTGDITAHADAGAPPAVRRRACALPVPAVLPVEPSWTRFLAELPPEARPAGAGSVGLVAAPVDALAHVLAVGSPKTLPTLAATGQLFARRPVAGTLGVAQLSVPAQVALALACVGVTVRVAAAVALVGARVAPEALVARAHARVLVAGAFLAAAWMLAVRPPAVGLAGAGPCDIVALAVGVAVAFALAVRTPVLGGALCSKVGRRRKGELKYDILVQLRNSSIEVCT